MQGVGIPCFLGGMARGLLGRNSSIQFRQCRRDALKEADVVILAGADCVIRLSVHVDVTDVDLVKYMYNAMHSQFN